MDLNQNYDQLMGLAQTYAMTYGLKLILFLVLLFITFKVAGWVYKAVFKVSEKKELDRAISGFLASISKYAVLVMGIISCLGTLGVETASFAAVLAASGFAIGMALQGTLSHFASGVMILWFKPFKLGDYILVGAAAGTVSEIGLFSTALDTPDNRRIILPNSAVYGQQIENVTFHNTRRVDVNVGTDYDANMDETRKVLLSAISNMEKILNEPAPAVVLSQLGASSVDWAVRVWVKTEDYWAVKDELTRVVKVTLDEAKIAIPYPHMELNVNTGLKKLLQ